MENLFSEDPQFRRVQYKKLSDNVREWQEEIGALVSEKLPKDLGLDVTMVFQNVDEEKGYAVGSAVAKDRNSGKSIGVPVIVKSWHLAPVDLFFSEGKVYPLTDKNVAKSFFQNSIGAGIATRKPPPNMADDSFAENQTAPLGGKYSYSSPISMIKLLEGTLGGDDLALMKEAVAKQPALLGAFHRHGTFDVLRKFAAENPKQDMQDTINKKRAQSLFTVKKDGPDAYRLYSSSDEVYDPVMIATDRQGLKNWIELKRAELWDFEKDPLHSIDTYGHFTIEPPKSPYGAECDGPSGDASLGKHKNPWVFDPLQDDLSVNTIDSFGRYGVRDADGVLAKGWVIPNVVSFDGKPVSTKLFLGKALASIQGRICGIALRDSDDDVALKPDRPDTGKIGTLLYREGDRVLATTPFQVTSVTVYKNMRSLGVVDYKGNIANLIVSPNIEGLVRVSDSQKSSLGPLLGSGANYIVSAKMSFVRMPRLCPVSDSPDEFNKLTVGHLDGNPVKVASANNRFIFRGGEISKYAAAAPSGSYGPFKKVAFDFNSLAKHEAQFLLRSWGLDQEKTAEVLTGASRHIQLEVHHLNFKPMPHEVKLASIDPARKRIIASMKTPVDELLKIAANLEDAQTVDSVLGLGFLNEENISRFASVRPMLWEVCHMLGKLLLGSRMGMSDIPEEATRAALTHLQRVIDGLDRLRLLDEQTKTSSANPPNHMASRQPKVARVAGLSR
jgi:hypothetical protein